MKKVGRKVTKKSAFQWERDHGYQANGNKKDNLFWFF
jgi:hypothetical protein